MARVGVLFERRGRIGLHRPHNSNTCTKQELRHVRDYLSSAGVSLSQLQAEQQNSSSEGVATHR